MIVDGIRMDHICRCSLCGRPPEVSTAYKGFEPGMGPFIIKCYCGRDPDDLDENGLQIMPSLLFRSWSKTRAVKGWRKINKREPSE
jgi:hypothetical protein